MARPKAAATTPDPPEDEGPDSEPQPDEDPRVGPYDPNACQARTGAQEQQDPNRPVQRPRPRE